MEQCPPNCLVIHAWEWNELPGIYQHFSELFWKFIKVSPSRFERTFEPLPYLTIASIGSSLPLSCSDSVSSSSSMTFCQPWVANRKMMSWTTWRSDHASLDCKQPVTEEQHPWWWDWYNLLLAQTSLVHHLSFFLRELFQCCCVSWPVFQGFGTELVNLFHSPKQTGEGSKNIQAITQHHLAHGVKRSTKSAPVVCRILQVYLCHWPWQSHPLTMLQGGSYMLQILKAHASWHSTCACTGLSGNDPWCCLS